jgi:hypothetical protein
MFARLRWIGWPGPQEAPLVVKRAIWAANQLRSRPYRYGGGHKSFSDSGYDCSGTVSYILGAAGWVSSPMSSSDLRGFGSRGCGKWITVYARNGHAFAVIAGLRLDTTAWHSHSDRWAPRGKRPSCPGGSKPGIRQAQILFIRIVTARFVARITETSCQLRVRRCRNLLGASLRLRQRHHRGQSFAVTRRTACSLSAKLGRVA